MIKQFTPDKMYYFSVIEAVNNSHNSKRPAGWIVKNLVHLDGQQVRYVSAVLGNCDGIMIEPEWCREGQAT
jgi:hypothetical protein